MNISFIGFGHMAKALAKGLQLNPQHKIRAAAPSLRKESNNEGIQTDNNNLAVIPDADILILAVKPAQMKSVLTQMTAIKLPTHCLIISIASGLSLTWFEPYLPNRAMVRAMPNIGASVGKSATPLIANSLISATQIQWAEQIFNSIGITTWLSKELTMDAFTALSGSGPAYVFLFLEAIIAAAVTLGIDAPLAQSFTIQTVEGALKLATQSKLSLAELRKTVTSPAGTTAAAMAVFSAHDFIDIIYQALAAAQVRAQQLGQG